MNYYEHHIGDFDQATAHLSAVEDGIYSRMIRWYMASEAPLPADVATIQRRVRAHARDEKAAVKTVLAEFFELREDGHHQKRCDEEVARYQDKQRKARASADARWGKSERNANALPPDDANGMRTHAERISEVHAPRTRTPTRAPARPQSPDTKHQTPEEQGAPPDATTSRARSGEAEPPNPEAAPGSGSPYGLAVLAMRQQGMADANPGHATLRALVDAGVTVEEFQGASAEAVGKGKGFAWALAALTNRRRDAAAAPIAGKAAANVQPDNPDVAATRKRLADEAARPITKPPADLRQRFGVPRPTGEPQ